MRRAAAAIPANLAEGSGRNTQPELARYCGIALGSANELEYHLLLARDLGYIGPAEHARVTDDLAQLKRMLAKFIGTLRR